MAMAKEKESDEYLWGTEVWHKGLLKKETTKKKGVLSKMFSTSKSPKKKNENLDDKTEGSTNEDIMNKSESTIIDNSK